MLDKGDYGGTEKKKGNYKGILWLYELYIYIYIHEKNGGSSRDHMEHETQCTMLRYRVLGLWKRKWKLLCNI